MHLRVVSSNLSTQEGTGSSGGARKTPYTRAWLTLPVYPSVRAHLPRTRLRRHPSKTPRAASIMFLNQRAASFMLSEHAAGSLIFSDYRKACKYRGGRRGPGHRFSRPVGWCTPKATPHSNRNAKRPQRHPRVQCIRLHHIWEENSFNVFF